MKKLFKIQKKLFTIIGLSILFTVSGQNSDLYSIGRTYQINSKFLNEYRTYTVGLPASYTTTNNKYPVFVLLDGESDFHAHSGIIQQMAKGGQIPEMIVVAVHNIDRVRDFTPTHYLTNLNGSSGKENLKTSGHSKPFLNFLDLELLPEINKTYRTNQYNILSGISHAGLLVGLSYLSEQSTFNAFISIDPSFWWDNQYIVKQIKQTKMESIKDRILFLSTADKFENFKHIPHVFNANRNSHERFNARLKNMGLSPNQLKLAYFEEENHWTVDLLSLYEGMKFIFKDLKLNHFNQYSYSEITTYYDTIYQGKFPPPEWEVAKLAYKKIESDPDEAFNLFHLNTINYPNSSYAFYNLGEAYRIKGDLKKAKTHYKRALFLNPKHKKALSKLNQLKQ